MDKKELIKQVNVSLNRVGLFFSEETKSFLWELNESELIIILRFCGFLSKFYRKAK